jgi:hypothetical protein
MARMVSVSSYIDFKCYAKPTGSQSSLWNNGDMGFTCTVCGNEHEELPLSYSVKAPQAVVAIPPDEVDQCVIDGRDFYLRGRIPVPIEGRDDPFIWGVWAEVSPKNFIRTGELWTVEGRETEPPFPGWLNTAIPLYGDTINLEVLVHTMPVGRRPHFEIVDEDHPLAIEQRRGITLDRIHQIAEAILAQSDQPE